MEIIFLEAIVSLHDFRARMRVIEGPPADISPSAVLSRRSMLPATSLTIKSTKCSHSEDRPNGTEDARPFLTAEEIVGAMRSKYPDHGNLTALLFSGKAAVKARAS
jgi:hypothetical protein